MEVHEEIRQLEPKPAKMKSSLSWTAEKVVETFAGTGVGRKTIAQIIEDHGLGRKTVCDRLKEKGINAKDGDKIKEIAENHESTSRKDIDHYFDR